MDTPVPPRRLPAFLLAGVIIAIILAMLWSIADVVKWAGAPFTILPAQLGLIRQVTRDQVVTIDMTPGQTTIHLPTPGTYVIYADMKQLMFAPRDPKDATMKLVTLASGTTGAHVPLRIVERGLMPYDTPFVPGRPVLTFTITRAGAYTVSTPRQAATIAILPDYITGNEQTIGTMALLQLGVLALAFGSIGVIRYRNYRQRLRVIEARQQPRRAQGEAFWQAEIQRQQAAANKQRERLQ
jgi:hypothetical protein